MDDTFASLGLTTRCVSTVDLDGRPARRVVMTRSYPTGVEDLWDALTNPERIPRWFLPVTGELRLGGSYQLEGNAGGAVEECEPPRRFRVTWVMGEAPTWLTVTLTAQGPQTVLELEHVGHVPEELWAQFGPSATGIGWDMTLLALTTHVTTRADKNPARDAAWMPSPAGLAFIQASADAWRDADLSTGTASDEATARAARTIAIYTGQAEPPQP